LPQERGVDPFFAGIQLAAKNGQIPFFYFASLQLLAKPAGHFPGLGDQDESGSFAIKTVDQRDLTAIREFEREQLDQFIPQRPAMPWLAWVGKHPGWLIDNQPALRFVNDD